MIYDKCSKISLNMYLHSVFVLHAVAVYSGDLEPMFATEGNKVFVNLQQDSCCLSTPCDTCQSCYGLMCIHIALIYM